MRSRAAAPALLATALLAGSARVAAQAPTPPPAPAAGVPAPVTPPPTPLEQAVMEHACRVPGQAMATPEAYETCLNLQLTTLRSEFGVDLQKLPAAERRAIDKACSSLRMERGRDAYVACLSDRLTRVILARGHQPPTLAPVPSPVEPALVAAAPLPASSPTAPPPPASSAAIRWILGGLVVALSAAGGAWVLSNRHARPAVVLCRVCGQAAQSGDLCAACRHEAAETQRRAIAERSEQLQALSEAAQQAELGADPGGHADAGATAQAIEAEQRRQEAARLAELEREREHQREREQEEARRRDADRRRWEEAAAAAILDAPLDDPHVVLGLAAPATADAVEAAFRELSAKYAAENVSHLGIELQDHYRKKAAAVQRAYEQLTGAPATVTPQA